MTQIRRAHASDAAVLADIGARTFAETFGHLYPPADLADFLKTHHNIAVVGAELADPAMGLWLAEADGVAVGYAVAGPCALPHPDVGSDGGELKRIYVLASARGGGLGTRLMHVALAWLEQDGPRPLWIGVWSQNLGAQRLYERHGFVKAGEYEFAVGATRDREFILRREPLDFAAARPHPAQSNAR